jgi:hypothetical protein
VRARLTLRKIRRVIRRSVIDDNQTKRAEIGRSAMRSHNRPDGFGLITGRDHGHNFGPDIGRGGIFQPLISAPEATPKQQQADPDQQYGNREHFR